MKLNEVLKHIIEYDQPEIDLEPRRTKDKTNIPSGRTGDERGTETDDSVVDDIKNTAEEIIGQDMEALGNGNFAIAFGSASDGSRAVRVTKRARSYSDLENDGYLRWMGAIIKSGMNLENPYLPRIYGIKFKKNEHNNYAYTVETEKLIDEFNMDGEHDAKLLYAAGARMFGEEALDEKIENMVSSFDQDDVAHMYGLIDIMITAAFEENGHGVRDKRLKKALELIDDIYVDMNKSKSVHDVGGDNMMYRRTPHGLFPVIIDPVFG